MQKRFLIVKLSALGDIIQAFPVAEYLRQRHPECHIDWIVKPQFTHLVAAHPCVDGTTMSGKYDAIFDLQGNCRSALVTLKAKGTKVGFSFKTVPEWPNALVTRKRYRVDLSDQITRQYLSLVRQFFRDEIPFEPRYTPLTVTDEDRAWVEKLDVKGGVMLCPGTAWPNKQPRTSLWKPLLNAAGEKRVLVWGTEEERLMCEEIDPNALIVGQLTFPRWQHLMSQMKLVMAVDSCALHLAALAKVPTFALFGPSNPSVYNPIGAEHRTYQGSCPYGKTFVKRCPLLRTCPTGACLKDADSQIIISELIK